MKKKILSYSELNSLYKREHSKLCRLEKILSSKDVATPNIISAKDAYNKYTTALALVYEKIAEAVEDGQTSCYIAASGSRPNRKIIQQLLDDGYDISYEHFTNEDNWFIKAYWSESSGTLFKRDFMTGASISTVEEMYDKEKPFGIS